MDFETQIGTNHSDVSKFQNDSINEDLNNSVREIDNKWYTFVSNDKNHDLETDKGELGVLKETKRPF